MQCRHDALCHHMKEVHEKRVFTCKSCGETFQRSQAMKDHKRECGKLVRVSAKQKRVETKSGRNRNDAHDTDEQKIKNATTFATADIDTVAGSKLPPSNLMEASSEKETNTILPRRDAKTGSFSTIGNASADIKRDLDGKECLTQEVASPLPAPFLPSLLSPPPPLQSGDTDAYQRISDMSVSVSQLLPQQQPAGRAMLRRSCGSFKNYRDN